MKNIIIFSLIFLSLLITGCEKDFSNVIDPVTPEFKVQSVVKVDTLFYNPSDSLFTIYIDVLSTAAPEAVTANIYNPAESKITPVPINLFDNGRSESGDVTAGDGRFSGRVLMSQNYLSGKYRIEFSVTYSGNSKKLAETTFSFNNGRENIKPVLSNLSAPDTLIVNTTVAFLMTVKVDDPNGLQDIARVYYTVTRPDGTSNNFAFQMFDNGNSQSNGDQIAGDGIYSAIAQVNETNQKGTYTFNFFAEDRGKLTSDPINHLLTIR